MSDVLDVAGFVVDDSETKQQSSDSIVRGVRSYNTRKSLEHQRTNTGTRCHYSRILRERGKTLRRPNMPLYGVTNTCDPHPSSFLYVSSRKLPECVVFSELVHTSRVHASCRCCEGVVRCALLESIGSDVDVELLSGMKKRKKKKKKRKIEMVDQVKNVPTSSKKKKQCKKCDRGARSIC